MNSTDGDVSNLPPTRHRAWRRAEKAKKRYLKVLLNGDGSQSIHYTVEDWDKFHRQKRDISVYRVDERPDGCVIIKKYHERRLTKMWYEGWKRKAGVGFHMDP